MGTCWIRRFWLYSTKGVDICGVRHSTGVISSEGGGTIGATGGVEIVPNSSFVAPPGVPAVVVGVTAAPAVTVPSLFSLDLRFWNQTWMTFMSSPVLAISSSLTSLEGRCSLLYTAISTSSCWGVILVRVLDFFPSLLGAAAEGWGPGVPPTAGVVAATAPVSGGDASEV